MNDQDDAKRDEERHDDARRRDDPGGSRTYDEGAEGLSDPAERDASDDESDTEKSDGAESKDDGTDEDKFDDGESRKPSLLSRTWFRVALLLAVILLVVGGILYYMHYRNYGRFQQSTNNAYLEADDVAISPKVSGYVLRVLVVDNQPVRAGQPLVEIDWRQSKADVAQAEAQVAASYAQARAAQAQIRQQ